MASTITYCYDNPIKTDIEEWIFNHKGRVSVGKEKKGIYEILAYSDINSDFPELYRIAKRNKAIYINSVISEGITAID